MRRTNVPALLEEYSEEEDDEERSGPDPSICRIRRRLVEICLVYLKRYCQLGHYSSTFCHHVRAESVTSVLTLPQKGSAPAPLNPSRVSRSDQQSFSRRFKGPHVLQALNRRCPKRNVVGAKRKT